MRVKGRYALTMWAPQDVQSIRPSWDLDRCERELANVEDQMIDRLVEEGWELLYALLPSEDEQ